MEPEETAYEDKLKETVEYIGKLSDTEIAALVLSLKDERAADHAVRQDACDQIREWQLTCETPVFEQFAERLLNTLSYSSDLLAVQELVELRRQGGIEKMLSELAKWKWRCQYLDERNDRLEDFLVLVDEDERVSYPNDWPVRTDDTMLLIGDKVRPDEHWEPMSVTGVELYGDHFNLVLNGYYNRRYSKGEKVLVPNEFLDKNGKPLEKGDRVLLPEGEEAEIKFLAAGITYGYRREHEAFMKTDPDSDLFSMECGQLRKAEDDDEEA